MNDNLHVNWERIDFNGEPDFIYRFFGKTKQSSERVESISLNNFERSELLNWGKLSDNDVTSSEHLSGSRSYVLKPNSYSTTYSFALDSIPFSNLQIAVDCWGKSKKYAYLKKVSIIVSIENNQGNILWKGTVIDDQLIDGNQWNHLFAFANYIHEKQNCTIKVYVWNTGKQDIYLDDFRVVIIGNK